MIFQPEIEKIPLSKLRNLQDKRLKGLVTRLYERVPFYKKKFDETGINTAGIRGVIDLHKLPFTKKSDLREHYPFGLFTIPIGKVTRIHVSSGTTGKPTVVGYSDIDLKIFSEVVARSLAAAGGRPGMMLQNSYGYGLFTGGLGLHYGAEHLGMTVVPVSGGMTERQLLLLRDFKPEMISCTPSYAQTLAEEIRKRGISLEDLNLKFAVLGAEPWTEAIRQEVEAGLNVCATNLYGLSEVIGPGVSQEDCDEKGTGSYIWEDHFFPEVVDKDTGEPLPEGDQGVLVFTTLTKEAMPLLRYWTNDITSIYYDKSFKRTHVKMGPIAGRADDMLIIRGVNLFHTQIEDLLKDISELSACYQLVITRDHIMDDVEVVVELEEKYFNNIERPAITTDSTKENEKLNALQNNFIQKIKDQIGLSMKVTLSSPGNIPRSDGGKLNRVNDLRKKN